MAKFARQESKPSGTINIENLSNLGFDVHITNVSGGDKAIQGVSVPVWTAKDGQDDLYGTKLADKVMVATRFVSMLVTIRLKQANILFISTMFKMVKW